MAKAFALIDRAVETLIFGLFLAIVLVGTAQVFNRYFFNYSLSWSEEFQRYGQIWVVFLGIPVAYRRGMHIGLDLIEASLPTRGRRAFAFGIDILWLVLGMSLIIGLWKLMAVLQFQRSPGLGLPMHWVYSGLMIGALYMILVGLRRMIANLRGEAIDPVFEGD